MYVLANQFEERPNSPSALVLIVVLKCVEGKSEILHSKCTCCERRSTSFSRWASWSSVLGGTYLLDIRFRARFAVGASTTIPFDSRRFLLGNFPLDSDCLWTRSLYASLRRTASTHFKRSVVLWRHCWKEDLTTRLLRKKSTAFPSRVAESIARPLPLPFTLEWVVASVGEDVARGAGVDVDDCDVVTNEGTGARAGVGVGVGVGTRLL